MKKVLNIFLWIALTGTALVSCNQGARQEDTYKIKMVFHPGEEAKILEAFLTLKDSTKVLLKAGQYQFDNLSIAALNHILIEGEGFDKTILDFSQQSTGGEGIRVTNVDGFEIKNMTIKESKGDLIKINGSNGVTINYLHAIWAKSDSTSGGYAIYPVLCKNVLIENCYVQGSSDAGIYVGQSDSAIVRNNKGAGNVAGCEIENTTNAEVYDNEFYNNTAGVLVFDLPDLSQRGGHVKVFQNNIYDNNLRNFAKAGSFGTTWGVGNAPPGSGVVVLATSNVQIYNNQIINNNSGAIILASGFATDPKAADKINDKYQPFSKNIRIHGNTIKMGNAFPEPVYEHHIGKLLVATNNELNKLFPDRKIKHIPAIIYDGFNSNLMDGGKSANPDSLCIDQTGDNLFVNANFEKIADPAAWKPGIDMAPFICK